MAGSEMKTHKSAVVIISPEEIWEPIQKIRRLYDRQCHRWMPHITLIYPFRPRSELERAVAVLSSGITALRAFALRLHRLQYFTHDRDRFTMWLDPGPREPIAALQAAFQAQVPDCDDVSKFPRGFTPHLSVGQAKGCRELEERTCGIQDQWEPLEFTVADVAIICRDDDGPFRVERIIPLAHVKEANKA